MRSLFVLFIVMPIVEMWLLIEVGSRIGAIATIGLVLLTAVVGVGLLKQQGFSTLLRVNQKLAQGELPASEVIEGIVLAIGGALLLTPGFVTDTVGFLCLLPLTRRRLVKQWLNNVVVSGFQNSATWQAQSYYQRESEQDGQVFEGEFREEKDVSSRLP